MTDNQQIPELNDYFIRATDGPVRQGRNLSVIDGEWTVRDRVVEAGVWFSGGRGLIAPAWVDRRSVTGTDRRAAIATRQVKRRPKYRNGGCIGPDDPDMHGGNAIRDYHIHATDASGPRGPGLIVDDVA